MTLEETIGILEKDIHTDPPKSAITARKHDKAILMADAESRNKYCGECGCKFDWSEIDTRSEA